MTEIGLKVYSLPFSVLSFGVWTGSISSFSFLRCPGAGLMEASRLASSQVHLHQSQRGASTGQPPTGLLLADIGHMWIYMAGHREEAGWLVRLGHMLLISAGGWVKLIPIRTESCWSDSSQIKRDSFLMKGYVFSRQNDKFMASFWMPLSSLGEWTWAIIKISVKVKVKKPVLNVKDIREF